MVYPGNKEGCEERMKRTVFDFMRKCRNCEDSKSRHLNNGECGYQWCKCKNYEDAGISGGVVAMTVGVIVVSSLVAYGFGGWAYSNYEWENATPPISHTNFSIGIDNYNAGIYYENFSVNQTSIVHFSYQYIVNGHLSNSSIGQLLSADTAAVTFMILSSGNFSLIYNSTNGYLGTSEFPPSVLTSEPNNAILGKGNYVLVLSTDISVSLLISQFSTSPLNVTGVN